MAAVMSPLMLPESIVRAAEAQARVRGVSVEDWVSRALAERLDTEEGVREYFRRRSAGATGNALLQVLDAVPSGAVDAGDEL